VPVWDAVTGTLQQTLESHTSGINAVVDKGVVLCRYVGKTGGSCARAGAEDVSQASAGLMACKT
jgi:hypothetical protein